VPPDRLDIGGGVDAHAGRERLADPGCTDGPLHGRDGHAEGLGYVGGGVEFGQSVTSWRLAVTMHEHNE
jgi:hypothetical protein